MCYVIGRVVRAIEENRLGREQLVLPYPD